MKQCTKCKNLYPVEYFNKDSQKSSGVRPSCKKCDNDSCNERYRKNREKYAEMGKRYRENNFEKISQKRKNNRPQHNKWLQEWKIKNPERHREHVRKEVERIKNDPQLKIKKNLRTRLGFLLRGKNKSAKTLTLLGCSMEEFKSYFESKFLDGMNWNNYGLWKAGSPMTWHIDHIIPCESFDLTDPEQQKKCFHHTNLQPLWAIDNLVKSSKIVI
jgi:hypothetical protein